ncbi:MAG: thioredoxin reductase (NADPH) [Chloroflexi bacterium]|nr:MAG: thioredoxin reductase (NADPH) [Chloroflexota bacterium]
MENVIIIGSGPAGLTAALYAARAELNPLVLTGPQIGGQIAITGMVENYPGFPDGVQGPELVDLMQRQAEKFGARIVLDSASEVDLTHQPFKVRTLNEEEYEAKTVIIASGATPRKLEIPGEAEFTGKGVSYCATCDGYFFRGKDVLVIGGGDSALEEGHFLTRYASKVSVVHRREQFRAGPLLQQRANDSEKMDFVLNSALTGISGNGEVNSVSVRDLVTGEETSLKTDGVFIFIGHDPNTEMFAGALEMDESNYLKTDGQAGTEIPGVFIAGEVGDPAFKQIASSVGMGCMAAIRAQRYLEEPGR